MSEEIEREEGEKLSDAVLARLLATPPDHKRNVKCGANPKRRGRPPKANKHVKF